MNKLIFAAFAVGAVLGVIVAWRYSEHRESEEEESFDEECDGTNLDTNDFSEESAEEEKAEAQQIAIDEGYTTEETVSKDEPYVIPADEFGFFEDFEEITLTYYSDDILTDDQDHIIDDRESIIGRDALSRLTNSDDETVYVRNEKLKADYEICYDYKRFAEVMEEQPEGYANG